MNWKHIRKQDVSRATVNKWDRFLNEFGMKISPQKYDEFHDFDAGKIKVRCNLSGGEIIIKEEEVDDVGRCIRVSSKLIRFLQKTGSR